MSADQVIAKWKSTPRDVAKTMIAKYGQPQEVTANRLIWHNDGPWKLTELVNEEIPHDFPMPHKDMLYQAIREIPTSHSAVRAAGARSSPSPSLASEGRAFGPHSGSRKLKAGSEHWQLATGS